MPAAIAPEVLARYEPIIGLEVHAQPLTRTKAFFCSPFMAANPAE